MELRRKHFASQGRPRGRSWDRRAVAWPTLALIAGTIAVPPAAIASAATTPAVSVSINPATARADVASTFVETYKANAALSNGTVHTIVPSGWTLPQTSNPSGPGYIVAAKGTCASVTTTPTVLALPGGGTQVTLSAVTCAKDSQFTLSYLQADALKAGTYAFGPTSVQTSPSASAVSIASPTVMVTAGPTAQFALKGSSSTSAGSSYAFTVTPEDAGGDASTFSGRVGFTSSDTGVSTELPGPTTISGPHIFSALLTTAGVQSITATAMGAVPTITGTLTGIHVNPASTALLAWSDESPVQPTPSGQFPVGLPLTFTLSATDRYHNVTPNYGGRVVFSSGTDRTAVLPAAYTFMPGTDHGSHSFRLTPRTVGNETYTATASLDSAIRGSTVIPIGIAVGPERAADLTGTVAVPFSQSFTASGASGPVHWSAANLPPWLTLDGTTGVASGTPTTAGVAGPFTITATDSSTPAHSGSWSYTVAVGQGSQTVAFTSSAPAAPYFGGPVYAPTGSSTSGLPVTFDADPSTSGVCTSADGIISFVGIGTCMVDAEQFGDADWLASPQVQQSFSVNGAAQTILFTSDTPADAVVSGPTYTPRASATSKLTVTFKIDPAAIGVCSLADGVVSFSSIGTCTIDADQGGDGDWLIAPEVQQSFVVAGAPQTISFTSSQPAGAVVGGPVYTPTATATSGEPVSLKVDDLAKAVCSMAADGSVRFSGVGVCIIDANQGGDDTIWAAAPQVQQTFDVGRGSQTIVFTSSAPSNALVDGPTYTPSVADASGPPPATDPVTLSIDASTASACSITGGVVSFTSVGICTIDADQAGDENYLPSLQVQQSVTVGLPLANQIVTFTSTAPAWGVDQGPTYSVSAAGGASGNPVVFSSPTPSVCTVSGSTVTFVGVGTCTVDADQAGGAGYGAAETASQSFDTLAPTAVSSITVGDQNLDLGGLKSDPNVIEGSIDNTFSGVVTNLPPGGATYQWTVITPDSVNQIVEPIQSGSLGPDAQTDSPSIDVPANSIPNFVPSPIQVQLTVTPNGGGAPVTVSPWILYRDSILMRACGTALDGAGIGLTPVPSASTVPLNGTLTISESESRPAECGFGWSGTVTFSEGDQVLATSTSPTDPVSIPASQLGVGNDVVTATYDVVSGVGYLPVSVDIPVTVTLNPQSVSFTSSAPSDPVVNGATYTPTATASSPLGVALTVDPSSNAFCSMSGGVVSFIAVGTCTIDANQGGDDTTWAAAPQVQQSFTVGAPFPQVSVTSLDDNSNTAGSYMTADVIVPPNPKIGGCPLQQFPDGGCEAPGTDLDGTGDVYFAATVPGVPNTDVTYNWQIFYPPLFGNPGVVFSDAGITGYNSPVLHLEAGSLPQLAGDSKAGGDPFWRVELTTTVNGTTSTSVFFRFIYDSDFSLDFSTDCQLFGTFMGLYCPFVARQLLPSQNLFGGDVAQTIAFTSTPPSDAIVGGSAYAPAATVDSGMPLSYSVDPTAASVCSMGTDGSVTFTSAGTCTIDANQAASPDYGPAEAQQSFQVGTQRIRFTSTAPLDVPVGGAPYLPTVTTSAPDLTVSLSIDPASSSVCSMAGGLVSFLAVGTCRIDANQAGDHDWLPAAQYQSFEVGDVGPAPQTISFTSEPSGADTGGASYAPQATSTSAADTTAEPVTFSIDSSTGSTCTMAADGSVSFTAAGTCTIDANQAGNAYWSAAAQVQQSFTVTATLPPALKVNVDYPQGHPQNPVLPPNPAAAQCAAQTVSGGGCSINTLDGAVDHEFDASVATDPNPNPAEDTVTYSWELFDSSGQPRAPDVTGYLSSELFIPGGSLTSSSDWKVELTATINGVATTTVFFNFAVN